jgi:hypothetical protein
MLKSIDYNYHDSWSGSKSESVDMEQDVTLETSYISEILYHFLPDNFGIFTSIVKNGLLCL